MHSLPQLRCLPGFQMRASASFDRAIGRWRLVGYSRKGAHRSHKFAAFRFGRGLEKLGKALQRHVCLQSGRFSAAALSAIGVAGFSALSKETGMESQHELRIWPVRRTEGTG